MESVLRGAAVYLVLLVLFRLAGRRTLAQTTPFDLVLVLIISETTQQALMTDDFSVTSAVVLIVTLLTLDIGMSLAKRRWKAVELVLDGVPTILVADGRPLADRLREARLDEQDILESARMHQGLERMDQIRFAVLEPGGGITIVPRPEARRGGH